MEHTYTAPCGCSMTRDAKGVTVGCSWLAECPQHGIPSGTRHDARVKVLYDSLDASREFRAEANTEQQRKAAMFDELVAVCKGYEQWEGDMILCDKAWDGGRADLPSLTWPLWDRLLELQTMRNAILDKAKAQPTPGA